MTSDELHAAKVVATIWAIFILLIAAIGLGLATQEPQAIAKQQVIKAPHAQFDMAGER